MEVGQEQTLLLDEHRYIAHPHMACLKDGSWLLVATCGPRRAKTLHPPLDPEFITIAIRSDDDGRTWSAPAPVPAYGATGTECSGLTALADGSVLLNQWRFRWYPEAAAPDVEEEPDLASSDALRAHLAASQELDDAGPDEIAWARGGGTTTLWRSDSGGRRWDKVVDLDTAPFSGGYGLRGGTVTDRGDVILPLSDVPHYRRVFLVRSGDGGRTWGRPVPVADADGREFEEPTTLALGNGRLLMLLRENVGRQLMAIRSDDDGTTWSAPREAGLDGFPAHLFHLADGRVAAVTACREPPGSVRLTVSDDEGETWEAAAALTVAGDLGTRDLGYPTATLARDGSVFVAYYRRDHNGVTGVHARRVRPSFASKRRHRA